VDRQTLLVRRSVAAAGVLLVIVLLVLGVRGCLDARAKRASKDYVRDVDALVQESNQQGDAFFKLLQGRGGRNRTVDLTNQVNGLRVQSAQLVDRARGTDSPDQMKTAQRYLLETLELRRDGLRAAADALPTALGDQERRQGTSNVAAQMQFFLASDVIYSARVRPTIAKALADEDLQGEVGVPKSAFVPDIQWLDPGYVSDRVGSLRTGRAGGTATPGLHGTGLASVTLGGQTLTSGSSATLKLSGNLQFSVQVQNQGENTETDVTVNVAVGRGKDAIQRDDRISTIAAGETKTVTIPLDQQPPTGQNVPITVEVQPVSGEKKTDNNKQQYSAIFTR
jgi:CARDB